MPFLIGEVPLYGKNDRKTLVLKSGGFDFGRRCGAGNETLAFAEIYFPDAEIHGFDVDAQRMRVSKINDLVHSGVNRS